MAQWLLSKPGHDKRSYLIGLCGDNREDTYNALCLLFAMAKTGELEPLVKAVEGHHDVGGAQGVS